MRIIFLLTLFFTSVLSMSAQCYLDGIEYYRADKLNEAKTILERTLNDVGTDKATSYYYLGLIALAEKDNATAKDYFDNGIAINSRNPYNYVGLASIDLANNNKKAADKNIKKAKKIAKKDAQLLVDIARAYFNVDPIAYDKDIRKAMKDAYNANFTEPAYYIFIGDTIALNAKTKNDIDLAVSNYEMAIYYDPASAVAYVKYSNLYRKVSLGFSIEKLKAFLSINPNSALVQRELADCLYDVGRWTQAANAYDTYIKNPSHLIEGEEQYALCLLSIDKYEEAYQVAKGVIGRTKNPSQMYRVMMQSKFNLEDYTEAAIWAQELVNSKDAGKITDTDHLTYGSILESLATIDIANAKTHNEAAIAQYNEALKVNDKCYDAYKNKSKLYSKMGDFANSVKSFEEFIAFGEAKAGDYHTYAGRLLNYANKVSRTDSVAAATIYDKAIDAATIAFERSNSPYAQERKALIIYSKNNSMLVEEVAEAFEKVVEILDANKDYASDYDTYKTALGVIGDYYTRIGQNDKAIAAYERYLTYNPENNKVRDRIDYLRAQQQEQIRQNSINQSIEKTKTYSSEENSIRRNRVTPDLTLFDLHGPVKTVSDTINNSAYYVTFSESGEVQKIRIASQYYSITRDSEGKIIKLSSKSEGYDERYSYVYGKDGFPKKEMYEWRECGDGYSEIIGSSTTKIQYNKAHNVIKKSTEGDDVEGGYWITQSYTIIKVDEYGNWIKRKCKQKCTYDEPSWNHSKTETQTRTITYYE